MNQGGGVLNIPMASLRTLSTLKINAVVGRASQKDFVDLYAMLRHGITLEAILQEARRRAPSLNPNTSVRALTYFDDAESEPMPRMVHSVTWEEVKERLVQEVSTFLKWEVQGPSL